MNTQLIKKHFTKIGARAKIEFNDARHRAAGVSIDIGQDGVGEFFELAMDRSSRGDVRVVDIQPSVRHLLLMAEQADGKHKFLCGHDERHWFVAAVPENRTSVSNVKTAFEALKPAAVQHELNRKQVKRKQRNRRRNDAFIRQGEWFFVPLPRVNVNANMILRHEPIARGGGKPHICEELVRQGGELVYVSPQHPNGLTEFAYRKLISRKPKLRNLNWITQRRNPQVLVRGKVRHADHKTIVLHGWHQVLMNTETQSIAMRHVAFID